MNHPLSSSLSTPHTHFQLDAVLKLPEVILITGRSEASLRRDERAGTFPKWRRIGKRAVGWLRSEIEAWLLSRAAA